ncbi:YfaZ family outer membrane protein [Kaarinaea lacus]
MRISHNQVSNKKFSGLGVFVCAVFACIVGFSAPATSASFDINLSDKSVQGKYAMAIGGSAIGRTELSFGVLYNDDDGSNYLGEVGLMVIDVAGSKAPGLEIGVGGKLYFADATNGDAVALGLGGHMRYKFTAMPRMNIGLVGLYAPSIVSFADADYMYELGASIGYELLPTANIYVGYRHIRADFDKGAQSIDETMMLGLKMSF